MTAGADPAARLSHVVRIGGGSGAGRVTIAAAVAARHDLEVCATDDVMTDHAGRCAPQDCPQLSAFSRMTADQRWLERSPRTALEPLAG